jgi:hypothetical protein
MWKLKRAVMDMGTGMAMDMELIMQNNNKNRHADQSVIYQP